MVGVWEDGLGVGCWGAGALPLPSPEALMSWEPLCEPAWTHSALSNFCWQCGQWTGGFPKNAPPLGQISFAQLEHR